MTKRAFIPVQRPVIIWLIVVWILLTVPAWASQPDALPKASHCNFLGSTLVPSLAMGVRRIGKEIDVLELRRKPDSRALIIAEAPIFRPFFVTASGTDAIGATWYLLQDEYTASAPLGWVPGKDLHLFQSRYAYTFANRERGEAAEFQDVSKESYERLLAQMKGDSNGGEDKVVVRERVGAERWRPVAIYDTVPFVELRIPSKDRDPEHPDTTPTFRFGIPSENRLVHMGAVCGGPIDSGKLRQLRATTLVDKDLAMLFVVDETVSMLPFNQVVANFIRTAGRLAEGRPMPVRVAVCAYTDGPPGTRVTLDDFKTVKGPADVNELAERVALLGNDLPPDEYSNPTERMLEGLRDALKKTKFQKGGTPFVAVVGDTGHEPTDPGKRKLVLEVAQLIKQTGVRTYFMHVGRRREPDEMLFQKDFALIQQEAVKLGVPEDHIVYEPAEANNLQNVLEKSLNDVEEEWRRLQRQIMRMESRTPYTEPGPKLLKALENQGVDLAKFDDWHLQYFVPSQGWLFHPNTKDTSSAMPQFRELFLLAEPEQRALKKLFEEVRSRLALRDQFESDAMVATFASELAEVSGNPNLKARVMTAWNGIPARQRSLGLFLEDVFGLRLKAALPFPPADYVKDQPATVQEISRMIERIDRLIGVFKDENNKAFWFEASSLVP